MGGSQVMDMVRGNYTYTKVIWSFRRRVLPRVGGSQFQITCVLQYHLSILFHLMKFYRCLAPCPREDTVSKTPHCIQHMVQVHVHAKILFGRSH